MATAERFDSTSLSGNFSVPPPSLSITPHDWQRTSLEVRRETWALWLNFRSAHDGTFGEQLQLLLQDRGLRQSELAVLIHQSPSVVNRWLKGRNMQVGEKHPHIPAHLSGVLLITEKLNCNPLEKHLLIRAYALEVLWVKGFWNE